MWTHLTRSNLHENIEHHLASDGGEGSPESNEKHGGLHVIQHQFKAQDVYRYPPPESADLEAQNTRENLKHEHDRTVRRATNHQ